MPLDPTIAQAGQQTLNQIFNTVSTLATNRANTKQTWKMYERQRSDALADWARDTEYNSPAAQMARLKAAGLNPHLIYGSGGATATSANTRGANFQDGQLKAPQIDVKGLPETFMMDQQIQMMKKQMGLMDVQKAVSEQEVINKAAQTAALLQSTEAGKFDLGQKQRLADTNFEQAVANLGKTHADIKFTLDQNERARVMQQQTLAKGVQEILLIQATRGKTAAETAKIRQEIRNLHLDEKLKEAEAKLREKGIYPGDPAWYRVVARGAQNLLDQLPQLKPQNYKGPAGTNPLGDILSLF